MELGRSRDEGLVGVGKDGKEEVGIEAVAVIEVGWEEPTMERVVLEELEWRVVLLSTDGVVPEWLPW